jgi:hypothetical protein
MSAETTNLKLRDLIRRGLHLENVEGLSPEELAVRQRKRIETLIGVCWGLIVLKTFVVVWVVHHYAMPFSPMWVIAPTVTMAFVATSAYYWLRD